MAWKPVIPEVALPWFWRGHSLLEWPRVGTAGACPAWVHSRPHQPCSHPWKRMDENTDGSVGCVTVGLQRDEDAHHTPRQHPPALFPGLAEAPHGCISPSGVDAHGLTCLLPPFFSCLVLLCPLSSISTDLRLYSTLYLIDSLAQIIFIWLLKFLCEKLGWTLSWHFIDEKTGSGRLNKLA